MTEKTKAEIKEKFANETYPIQIIGRHLDVTDAMKSYAIEKLKKVERLFGGRVMDVMIIMDIQKLVHLVDFIITVNNTKIKVVGRTENMYASIDQAIARLNTKLTRYNRRLHEHHAKGASEIETVVNVIGPISPLDDINDQIEEENLKRVEEELRPHAVVSRETYLVKTLNQEEAVMKMELSEEPFMLYLSEEAHKLRVIYRRLDGHYGIIEPE